jgi:plastocyanin
MIMIRINIITKATITSLNEGKYMKKLGIIFTLAALSSPLAMAQQPTAELIIKDHRFQPAEITVPAGQKVKLMVHNQDSTPEEFESYELNREKIIPGGQQAVIYIGPLKPGKYPFFGEFNAATAKGVIIAK